MLLDNVDLTGEGKISYRGYMTDTILNVLLQAMPLGHLLIYPLRFVVNLKLMDEKDFLEQYIDLMPIQYLTRAQKSKELSKFFASGYISSADISSNDNASSSNTMFTETATTKSHISHPSSSMGKSNRRKRTQQDGSESPSAIKRNDLNPPSEIPLEYAVQQYFNKSLNDLKTLVSSEETDPVIHTQVVNTIIEFFKTWISENPNSPDIVNAQMTLQYFSTFNTQQI